MVPGNALSTVPWRQQAFSAPCLHTSSSTHVATVCLTHKRQAGVLQYSPSAIATQLHKRRLSTLSYNRASCQLVSFLIPLSRDHRRPLNSCHIYALIAHVAAVAPCTMCPAMISNAKHAFRPTCCTHTMGFTPSRQWTFTFVQPSTFSSPVAHAHAVVEQGVAKGLNFLHEKGGSTAVFRTR
jgi:hypothetical protein